MSTPRGVGAGRLHAGRFGGIVRRIPVRVAGVDEGDEVVCGRRRRCSRPPRARGGACRSRRAGCRTAAATTSSAPPARSPRAATARGAARSSRYSQGRRSEASEAGVHAARIGLDDRAFGRRRSFDHAARDGAEAEAARAPVLLQRHRAKQLRQLARRQPARQVHLEEAVLRVRVTRWRRRDRCARRR